MKLIFLDIDGVLNTKEQRREYYKKTNRLDYLDRELCLNLQKILDAVPDAKIVISSMWRCHFTKAQLKRKLKLNKVDSSRIIDITPFLHIFNPDWPNRGAVIQKWINTSGKVSKYIILDDIDDGLSWRYGDRFIHIADGLDTKYIENAIKMLSDEFNP